MKLDAYDYCVAYGEKNPCNMGLVPEFGEKYAKTVFFAKKEYSGWKGLLHGGVAATLLDQVMFWAVYPLNKNAVTAEMNVKYKKPMKIEKTYIAESKIVDIRHKIFFVEGTIKDNEGNVYAIAKSKFMSIGD